MSDDNKKRDKKNKDFDNLNPWNDSNSNKDGNQQNKFFRQAFIWVFIITGLILIYLFFQTNQKPEWPITYSEYMNLVKDSKIKSAIIKKAQTNDFEFHGELKDKITVIVDSKPRDIKYFITKLGVLDSSTEQLWESKGITWNYEESVNPFWTAIISLLPWLLIIGAFVFFLRRMQNGGNSKGIFSFGKARVRSMSDGLNKVTFADVAGADEAKFELEEIIEFLRHPAKFQKLGGKIPKGVLLLGPPGTGKTLLARAVAGEAEVPFYSISGADFVEMFVGVGASRVRDLFDQAKRNSPCIVFIDEIDAVGRHRGAGLGGGHDEREQTLNQLLVEMDGFEQNSGVIIIAATNRPDVLDPALLRPGRFDRQIVVDRPDVRGRQGIFKVHTAKIPLGDDVDLEILARGTPGLSGADIANIVNESALLAARRNSDAVTMYDFENARDKVLMGIERKSLVISDKEKEMTAYHELGHALVGKLNAKGDPVHKISIIPRGRALGLTSYLPIEDSHSFSMEYIQAQIVNLLAGRAAEKLVFNQLTTGASNDIERATKLARRMVCEWGMSPALGPIHLASQQEEVFLGREISQPRDHSEDTARQVDDEVNKILTDASNTAQTILETNIELLHKLAKVLIEREVLDGEELDMLVDGKDLPPISKNTMNAIKSMSFNKETEEDKAVNNVIDTEIKKKKSKDSAKIINKYDGN